MRPRLLLAVLPLALVGTAFARGADAPPSAPDELVARPYSGTAGAIRWRRSSDDRGVRGYELTRNGRPIGTVDALSRVDTDLVPGTDYRYTVAAIDTAGQRSATVGVTLRTPGGAASAAPGPAAPEGLRASVYSSSAGEVSWTRPGTPGLRYEVRRDGTVLATTDGVSHVDLELAAGREYRYEVVAIDREGRRSDPAVVTLRTPGVAVAGNEPMTVSGQELGQPLPGAEILPETVQIEHTAYAACALRDAGDVFCWERGLTLADTFEDSFPDIAGFSKLNEALNGDIASITLDEIHLCGIGRVSGVACVASDRPRTIAFAELQSPPEPEAGYLSISELGTGTRAVVCAIQTDNRVVCWGARGGNTDPVLDVPPEAAFLRQVDVGSFRACGIDLNDAVVCWGRPSLLSNGDDRLFGDVDVTTIGPARQISMGSSGACVVGTEGRLECFGRIRGYTDILSDRSFSSIELDDTDLCFETVGGEKDCLSLSFSEDGASAEPLFPSDVNVRLVSLRNSPCYVTTDEVMKCVVDGESSVQDQFPTAPRDLSADLFSDTRAELTWARPDEDRLSDAFATGYEIFRDGVLIARLPVVTSYVDGGANPDAGYEVRATRGLVAGASSFVGVDGSDDP